MVTRHVASNPIVLEFIASTMVTFFGVVLTCSALKPHALRHGKSVLFLGESFVKLPERPAVVACKLAEAGKSRPRRRYY